MQEVQNVQVSNKEILIKHAPSRFDTFANIVWTFVLISIVTYMCYTIVSNNIIVKKQINAGFDEAMNSPKIKAYRIEEERRQREIAKQKRLKQLGIESGAESVQKEDLLKEQLREQEIAKERERAEKSKQIMDYRQKLEIYRQAQEGKIQNQ